MPTALPALLRRFSGPKQRRRPSYETSRGELLETRVLPAAVASASKTTLTITGDAEANDLQIEQVTGGVKVTALNGTTLTVGGNAVTEATFNGITSLNVRLGEGDDSVAMIGALNLKNVNIDLGDGDNVLSVGAGATITGKLTINGGTGADQVTLDSTVGKTLSLNLNGGNDEVSLLGTSFSSTVSINTGAGADTVTINENGLGVDASFNNNVTITTGEDNDTVSISNATTKKLTISTGDDDDTVSLNTVTVNGLLNVNTSAGADVLNIINVDATLSGTNQLSLGTGADDVVIASSSFKGNVNIDLGTGIVNTLTIDDTDFLGSFSLNANGSVGLNGVGDVINIETDTSLLGATTFQKTAKLKVGANADINLGVLNVASDTNFLSSVSISGVNPAADLSVALANVSFFSAPILTKVDRIDLI
ncbi:MAG TPA: hypothetical protein VM510_12275 [Caulifigura sp.]|jgi:hypothetical protein|nr:hypothetical protein [Caulifigura sp.]